MSDSSLTMDEFEDSESNSSQRYFKIVSVLRYLYSISYTTHFHVLMFLLGKISDETDSSTDDEYCFYCS